MSDPYLQSNGTLRNLLGITDRDELSAREFDLVAVRLAILDQSAIGYPFDFDGLKSIHRFLFEDVYGWAGAPRTIPLAKHAHVGDPTPVSFVHPSQIARRAGTIFGALANANYLRDLSRAEFAKAIAGLFVALNNLHPFREGNGRTQRAFIEKLAEAAGHRIEFDVVTRERMIAEILDPDRIRALRTALTFLKKHAPNWNDLYIATTVAGQTYKGVLVGRSTPDFMLRVDAEPNDWIAIGSETDLPDGAKSQDPVTITPSKWSF